MTLPAGVFLTVWGFLAVNVMSPGPNVLNTIATAMGSGRRAGLASTAGVAVGIGVWCLGMTLGMAAAVQAVPDLKLALTLVAIGLLLWFAQRYLRAAWAGWRDAAAAISGRKGLTPRASFLRSLSVNATNPKALTTWVAILSLFPVGRAGTVDIMILALGASAVATAIHTTYALVFSSAPAARFYLRAAPAVNAAVAVFFIGFALRLAAGLAG